MVRLEEIQKGMTLEGVVPGQVVRVRMAELNGDSLDLIYEDSNGGVNQTVLFRESEGVVQPSDRTGGWTYDADGGLFRLTSEAYRIRLAHLFDPFIAVNASNVIPLPHQIQAVYGCMLPKHPLRFLLADDPGAGKTIMAGLFIKELLLRGDLHRCLILAPGSVVDNWQAELLEKFSLDFEVLDNSMLNKGNPFDNQPFMIARVHHVAWRDDLKELLQRADDWDLIIVDEAHKMSASYAGRDLKKTKLYRLGEIAGEKSKHLVMMTATPHSGHHENFQLFMQLLDPDQFAGRYRQGSHAFDTDDVMRRMVKEELTTMDGEPLFPPREALTAKYDLTPDEMHLYHAVTHYVREEMNRAQRSKNKGRANVVGFALTMLQRRLASSPEAIFQSLHNRRKRLELTIEEIRRGAAKAANPFAVSARDIGFDSDRALEQLLEDEEAFDNDEEGELADAAIDLASAAETIPEMEAEIGELKKLEILANDVRKSGVDRKWDELQRVLETPEMRDPDGTPRKIIIFTEHKATLDYLKLRIGSLVGKPESILTIHGGVNRQVRLDIQEAFWHSSDARILLATDAAGEGINLQCANLVVNYDMPWNPNKLEQRFGRVHRIGQKRVCFMWNLVATGTMEDRVWGRLLEKIANERDALGGGKVFDVLGSAFEGKSLRQMFLECIEGENDIEYERRSDEAIEAVLQTAKQLVAEHSAAQPGLSDEDVEYIRKEMERSEARKLQPHFIGAFFVEAAQQLGIQIHEREPGRYQVKHVPFELRKRREGIAGEAHVRKEYKRITFEKEKVDGEGFGDTAALVGMGHPLLEAVIDEVLDQWRHLLAHGTILIDPDPDATEPRILAYLESQVDDARKGPQVASKEFQFLERTLDGEWEFAGYAPYLDYDAIERHVPGSAEQNQVQRIAEQLLSGHDWRDDAASHARGKLLPEHLERVKAQRVPRIEKLERLVRDRLDTELRFQGKKILEYKSKGREKYQLAIEQAERTYRDLEARRDVRLAELEREKHLSAKGVRVISGVMVLPIRLLQEHGLLGRELDDLGNIEDTKTSELAAMRAVIELETAMGNRAVDVSARRGIGYDIESWMPDGTLRAIEVKARHPTGNEICFTYNEVFASFNKKDNWILAIVQVKDGRAGEVRYLRQPFETEPGMNVSRLCEFLKPLWEKGEAPS